MSLIPVSFICTNHLNHIHIEFSRDEVGKSAPDWGSYWIMLFPNDLDRNGWEMHATSLQSLGGSLLTAFSIWEVAVLVGMDCNKHVAVPHPQLMEMSQSYPSFVPWTTLSHGLLNRIPKMLIEQACLHYRLWKSELTRRKPSMNPNRRSLKESFNSTG